MTKETPALPATWKVELARDDMPGVWAGGTAVCAEVVRDTLFEESCKHTSPFARRQCSHRDVFSLEQLPEIVRLDIDVHMVAAAPERAVTRSPLQNAVVGTG